MNKPDSNYVRDLVVKLVCEAIGDLSALAEVGEYLRQYEVENWLDQKVEWRELCELVGVEVST